MVGALMLALSQPVAGTSRSLLLNRYAQVPNELVLECDDGVLDYLDGSKKDVPVIPYSAACVKKYLDDKVFLQMPASVGIHMKGLPRTGTEWTQMVLTDLLQGICESQIYNQCEAEHTFEHDHKTHLSLFIPGQAPEDRTAAVLRLTTDYEHLLTYNFSCKHLEGHENYKEECSKARTGRVHNLATNQEKNEYGEEEWKNCIYKGPYSSIDQCIPEYMRVAEFPWSADMGLMKLMSAALQRGYKIDPSTSQRKYVVTLRDPRDSASRHAHYLGSGQDPNKYLMREGCKDYITSFALFYYWQVNVQGKVYPTLPVWYKHAVDKPAMDIERMLEFTGLRATRDIVNEVVLKTSTVAQREMDNVVRMKSQVETTDGILVPKIQHFETFVEELRPAAMQKCNEDMLRVLSTNLLRKVGLKD